MDKLDPQSLPMPDKVYHAVGNFTVAWACIDDQIEGQMRMMNLLRELGRKDYSDDLRSPELEAAIPSEARFKHRLKLFRRIHFELVGDDCGHMARVDRTLDTIREIEPIRGAVAHGKIMANDANRDELQIFTHSTIKTNPRTRIEDTFVVAIDSLYEASAKLYGVYDELGALMVRATDDLIHKSAAKD